MTYWWEGHPSESYWCEITGRDDIGSDLKAPQADEKGSEYWSYSLIRRVWPGDIVFHYSTEERAFVGASVAGGPVEERPINWTPHGTVGRSKSELRPDRPGWWLPLYRYTEASNPLTLDQVQLEQAWVRGWIAEKAKATGTVAAPFQLYPGKLRAAQGYLTKMPREFVERWSQLSALADALGAEQEKLTELGTVVPPSAGSGKPKGDVTLKSDADYVAFIRGGEQRRTRTHERLVRVASEWLRLRGGVVTTPHPMDLVLSAPVDVLFEIKVVKNGRAGHAIREAVGQLFEYRHFLRPACPRLCILLSEAPGPPLLNYVESALGLWIGWFEGERLVAGPRSSVTARDILG